MFLELGFVGTLVECLEDILETTIIFLKNSVFSGHIERVVAAEGVFEAGVGESFDGAIVVEHEKSNSRSWIFRDVNVERFITLEIHRDITCRLDEEVSAVIDITIGVSADDDWLGPVLDQSGDILDEDGLSKNGAIEVVSDGSVGTLPHLLEFELLDSRLIGGDGGALDADLAVFDGLGSIEGDLVVSLVPVLHAQVEVLDVEVEVGVDQVILDELPEDPGHLVSVQLGHGVAHLYFLEGS